MKTQTKANPRSGVAPTSIRPRYKAGGKSKALAVASNRTKLSATTTLTEAQSLQSTYDISRFMKLANQKTPPPNAFLALMGMDPRPLNELLDALRQGFFYDSFDHFQQNLAIPGREVAIMLQIPGTTLARRKRRGRLDTAESERLLRYTRLFAGAVELFEGDAEAAREWLRSPQRALNDNTPLATASTELGAREVERLIDRLEEGVFS